ncbi:MAG: hypothetical protein Q8P93_00700 [bacterium]|nr:hypothetical protein [bacterium]
MKNIFTTIIHTVLDILFPPACVACNTRGAWLCTHCHTTLDHSHYRPDCNTIASTHFTGAARQLVHRTKYRGAQEAGKTIAEIMYDICLEDISEYTQRYPGAQIVVTYIPTRNETLRERGFDHAHTIAQHFAGKMDVPLVPTLTHTKRIPRMAKTRSRATREKLLNNSMKSILTQPLSNTLLIIIDDVVTTGSTIREAQRALHIHTTLPPLGVVFAHTPVKKY